MPRYIVIEGCLGAGKTTLVMELSRRLDVKAFTEQVSHPFIQEFYEDPLSTALETQLTFVVLHYHQIARAVRDEVFQGDVVSDFFFEKDLIFSKVTLNSREDVEILNHLWATLRARLPTPDLVLFLDAPTEFLFERIRRRARGYEAPIAFDFLEMLNNAYREFMTHYDRSETVVFDAKHLDASADGIMQVQDVIVRKLEEQPRIAGVHRQE